MFRISVLVVTICPAVGNFHITKKNDTKRCRFYVFKTVFFFTPALKLQN